jgi:hypothetical protein
VINSFVWGKEGERIERMREAKRERGFIEFDVV